MADGLSLGKTLVKEYYSRRSADAFRPRSLFSATRSPALHLRSPDPSSLHQALRAFERRMLTRAKPEMIEAWNNMEICFGPDPARTFNNAFFWMMAKAITSMVVFAPITLVRKVWADDE